MSNREQERPPSTLLQLDTNDEELLNYNHSLHTPLGDQFLTSSHIQSHQYSPYTGGDSFFDHSPLSSGVSRERREENTAASCLSDTQFFSLSSSMVNCSDLLEESLMRIDQVSNRSSVSVGSTPNYQPSTINSGLMMETLKQENDMLRNENSQQKSLIQQLWLSLQSRDRALIEASTKTCPPSSSSSVNNYSRHSISESLVPYTSSANNQSHAVEGESIECSPTSLSFTSLVNNTPMEEPHVLLNQSINQSSPLSASTSVSSFSSKQDISPIGDPSVNQLSSEDEEREWSWHSGNENPKVVHPPVRGKRKLNQLIEVRRSSNKKHHHDYDTFVRKFTLK